MIHPTFKGIFFNWIYGFWVFIADLPIYWRYPSLIAIDSRRWVMRFLYSSASKKAYEKNQLPYFEQELTSGTTPYRSFLSIASRLPISDSTLFYDLGCADGHLVTLVQTVFGCKSIGIDILPSTIRIATMIHPHRDVQLIKGDFLTQDLSDGTLFFIASTCFLPHTLRRLGNVLESTKPGTIVMSVSALIPNPSFVLIAKHVVLFSWGKAVVYVQQKQG